MGVMAEQVEFELVSPERLLISERCTVLAEEAVAVEEIDRAATQQALKDAQEDLEDAKDQAARDHAALRVKVLEAKVAATQS